MKNVFKMVVTVYTHTREFKLLAIIKMIAVYQLFFCLQHCNWKLDLLNILGDRRKFIESWALQIIIPCFCGRSSNSYVEQSIKVGTQWIRIQKCSNVSECWVTGKKNQIMWKQGRGVPSVVRIKIYKAT